MSTETYRVRRLDDLALFGIFTEADQAAREAIDGGEINVELAFAGVSVLGRLDFSENQPLPGRYTIKRASLALRASTGSGNKAQQSTVAFTLDRGTENELDVLTVTASGNNQAPWQSDPGRAAFTAAFDVLNAIVKPSDADPGTPIGQLTNFADSIDRSFRGFTKGVDLPPVESPTVM